MKLLAPLFLVCVLLSCKNSEKKVRENSKIESAIWSNWLGGVPGVGGNTYEITLSVPANEKLEVTSLIIEDTAVEITSQNLVEGKLVIVATENKSNIDETIPRNNRRPALRSEDPEKAILSLKSECCNYSFQITSFTKGTNQKNQ